MKMQRAIYKATKDGEEYIGNSAYLSKKINAPSHNIQSVSSGHYKVKGWKIEKVGNLVEEFRLYQNGKVVEVNILETIAKKYYFQKNTLISAMIYKDGKCYGDYKIEHTGNYQLVTSSSGRMYKYD